MTDDTRQPDYYVGISNLDRDDERTVIPIFVSGNINVGPVQITIDNGLRAPVLMLELNQRDVIIGGWPDGEEWVKHVHVTSDRLTKFIRSTKPYEAPDGLTIRPARGAWAGTFLGTVEALLSVLAEGPTEVEILANLADVDPDVSGDVICRGQVTSFIDGTLQFAGGLSVYIDDIGSITLLD